SGRGFESLRAHSCRCGIRARSGFRARLRRGASSSGLASGVGEVGGLRDLLGRRPDHDRDLLAVRQQDRAWVALVALAVHGELDVARAAVATDTVAAQAYAPFGEELAEPVRHRGCRLGMEDAGPVVCVQRRDARLRAQLDAPVRLRAVRSIAEGLDV